MVNTIMASRNKAVVVGGSGLIGSRLALALAETGIEVTTLDIVPPPSDTANRCRHIFLDITDRESLEERIQRTFLRFPACRAPGQNLLRGPSAGLGNERDGCGKRSSCTGDGSPGRTRRLPKHRRRLCSPDSLPGSEQAPKHYRGLYVSSKLAGEAMVHAHAEAALASAVVLRFFTVYGPGPAAGVRGHFVASWIERMRAGLPLTVHGDGNQTIDMTHVSDVTCRVSPGHADSVEAWRDQDLQHR